ncbi:MAG: hypothetical protein A2940_00900 [Candidatus Wildermuthbacteria bacterium RIFCSPLOWO2_01_FULL_48_29]|uniref:MalT-like TPR region domain-containing protein n=2 Tax=Candidatus Wildermuthiibacteriota TaxID=1817923 RepID=A0A1G2RMM4_9BACT|nr:MAG: hypothetical protein A2843_01005 [Candidatus Wildermuthbacteria bacterium RIFCSPHIGHO2_01_FULL_48_27b]OHA73271.1 MAG: hypothetical protein A2940_00900 [Candidatus Wildermuthbacteria bacterium RIFCSPLOWO2_01_FULL_48_29]
MTIEEQADRLYSEGKYREVIAIRTDWRRENPDAPMGRIDLRAAWAHYQLGEFPAAEEIALPIVPRYPVRDALEANAGLLLAHCAERQGKLVEADERLVVLPASRGRDNLAMTIMLARKRAGAVTNARVLQLAVDAMMRVPYDVVDAHIINNVAWLLHQSRGQADVPQILPILPGLVEMAIGIYDAVGAADNHRAGVRYRAALIFEAAGWLEGARTLIQQSVELWRALVAREGGDRFASNLAGAEEVFRRLGA